MGSLRRRLSVVMVAAMVVVAAATMAEAQQSCVNNLVPCVNYINGSKPSSECCDSIKEAVTKDLPCLCNIYKSPDLLQSFNVSVDQALNLTNNCGVPVRLDRCNSTAPSPAHTPPGVKGSDNGSEKAALAGIFTIFLFFVSTLFY